MLAAVAAVVAAILIAPAGALACGGGGMSAAQIYRECGPSAAGGAPLGAPGQQSVPVSQQVQQSLGHFASKDKADAAGLKQLLENPGFGATRSLTSVPADAVVAPSTLSAVFDLGAGPLALIAVLGATALTLLAGTGWRGWRRWRGGRLAA